MDDAMASDLQQVIGRVTAILSRRRWLLVIPLLTGMIVSLTVSLAIPRRYVLSTIFERRDDVVITKLITANSPYSFGILRRSLEINLKGYQAMGVAADELGLTRDFPRDEHGELTPAGRAQKQQLVSNLASSIELGVLEKSDFLDLIEVRYKGSDPDLGVRLVAQLSDNYMRNTREWITQILVKSKEFFSTEAQKRTEVAVTREAELLQMAVAHPGISPTDPDLLGQRLIAVNLTIEDTVARQQEIQAKIKSLTEYLEALQQPGNTRIQVPGMPNGSQNPQKMRLLQEMDRVKTEIADAKALRQMTDNHPHVAGLREKLEQLRIASEQLPDFVANPSIGAGTDSASTNPVLQEQRRTEHEIKTLTESLARSEKDLAKRKVEKARLEEEKGMLFERRQNFLTRQQELSNIKTDLQVWKGHVDTISRVLTAEEGKRGICFSTVEAARRPRKPISPTPGGIFLLSVGIGLALGVAAVFLREVFDRTLRDPARIRHSLGIPVLETIGEIRTGSKPGLFRRKLMLPAVVGVEAVALAAVSVIVFVSLQQPDLYDRYIGGRIPTGWLNNLLGS